MVSGVNLSKIAKNSAFEVNSDPSRQHGDGQRLAMFSKDADWI